MDLSPFRHRRATSLQSSIVRSEQPGRISEVVLQADRRDRSLAPGWGLVSAPEVWKPHRPSGAKCFREPMHRRYGLARCLVSVGPRWIRFCSQTTLHRERAASVAVHKPPSGDASAGQMMFSRNVRTQWCYRSSASRLGRRRPALIRTVAPSTLRNKEAMASRERVGEGNRQTVGAARLAGTWV